MTDTDGEGGEDVGADELHAKGMWFGLASVGSAVLDLWERAGTIDTIGTDPSWPTDPPPCSPDATPPNSVSDPDRPVTTE